MTFDIQLIGYIAGLFTVSSFIPQAVKTYRTKDVCGLSLIMYTLFNIGTICWITYGIIIRSYPLAIFNSITFLFSFPVWIMIIRYKCKQNYPARIE